MDHPYTATIYTPFEANSVLFTIWYDVGHQNSAVSWQRLFKVSYIEIYWGFVRVIQIWSYLK